MTNGHQPKGNNAPKSPPSNPPNVGSSAHHPTGAGLFPSRKNTKSDYEAGLRDDFAKVAMGSLIANTPHDYSIRDLVAEAYTYADAMLEERKR